MSSKDIFSRITGNECLGEYNCRGSVMYLFKCDFSPERSSLEQLLSAENARLNREFSAESTQMFLFTQSNKNIYIHYSDNEKLLRVICDSNTKLPSFVPGASGNKCPVKLWQFEVDHSLIDCGMCYLVQLSDYSFFVIDSAHVYSVRDDIRLYEFMRERTPSELPVRVAGWFFSHAHSDHIVKFLDVLRFNKDIRIEGLYFNFAPVDHPSSVTWDESEIHHAVEFYEIISERTDIPCYTLHSGERFYVGELEFTVLCTHEDVFPNSLENYNDSSTVLLMKVGDDSVLFPGDAGGEESRILETRFTQLLKCDILQAAHHGHFGLSPEFYRRAAAHVVLFPTTKIKYDEELPHYEANRIAADLAKYVFIASDGTAEFTFPLESSTIKLYPDEVFENFDGIKSLWSYEYTDEFKAALKKRYDERSTVRFLPY